MSISIKHAVKEYVHLSGSENSEGLEFGNGMALSIADRFKEAVTTEPRGEVTLDTIDGRGPADILVALGIASQPETFEAAFKVYSLGTVEMFGEADDVDLYVAELDGDRMAIAYCESDSFKEIQENAADMLMSSLVFDKADLDEMLEALNQDFDSLPSEED